MCAAARLARSSVPHRRAAPAGSRSTGRGACRRDLQSGPGRAPYPEHSLTLKQWAEIPPRPVRLDQLITTKRELALDKLLAEDSTFYGDLFPHVVQWEGGLYLEDGLHRALRAALQQRTRSTPGCWCCRASVTSSSPLRLNRR